MSSKIAQEIFYIEWFKYMELWDEKETSYIIWAAVIIMFHQNLYLFIFAKWIFGKTASVRLLDIRLK